MHRVILVSVLLLGSENAEVGVTYGVDGEGQTPVLTGLVPGKEGTSVLKCGFPPSSLDT